MKLPRYTATIAPPKETGLVRAQDTGALTDVGSAEFRAIEGAGRAIQQTAGIGFQVYMDRQALDDLQKMGEISIKAQESEKLGIDEIGLIDIQESRPLPNDPDYYKGDKIPDSISWAKSNEKVFADHKKRILDLATPIKNPKTRQKWINSQLIRGADSFGRVSRAKYDEYQQATFLGYAKDAASNGDIETANKWIDIAEKYGLIGPKKAAAERDKNIENYIVGLYRKGNHDEARKALEASSLDSKQKEILDDEIDSDERNSLTQAGLAIEQKDDAIGAGFLDLLTNKLDPAKPQLTFDMIKVSELSFDAKKEWFTLLRVFDNYSEQELKEAFTDKGEVLADIYDKIDDGTLTDELDTMVGKGLSPITAQRIKTEVREPYKKDTEQLFKRIFGWSPELGFENELSSFLYEKTLRTWEAEIKAQKATGEKIIEIGRSIARPYFLEHLKTVMPSETNISRMIELALGEEIKEVKPAEPTEVKEQETVKPELYEVGESRTDEKGQFWEYIGNNKWQKK